MKVFNLLKDIIYDYDGQITVKPYAKYEDAKKAFDSSVNILRADAITDQWVLEEDSEDSFFAYEDGYEGQSHYYVAILEDEI